MITQDQRDAAVTVGKAGTAWGSAYFAHMTVSEFAQLMAAFYTFLLICDWFWRRMVRPYAEGRGWVPRKHMRATDLEDDE